MTNEIIPVEFLDKEVNMKLLNKNNVSDFVKNVLNTDISENALYILNDELKELILKAYVRTTSNNRKVIQGKDI